MSKSILDVKPIPGWILGVARQAARLTQDEMARCIGCSRQSVLSWENERSVPSMVYLRALLACLQDRGVTLSREADVWTIAIQDRPE